MFQGERLSDFRLGALQPGERKEVRAGRAGYSDLTNSKVYKNRTVSLEYTVLYA